MQDKHKWHIGATISLIMAVLCWSTVPLFLRCFTPYIDGWTANGYRYPLAAIFYLPWLFNFLKKKDVDRKIWRMSLFPAVCNLTAQCLWAWAPYYIEPGLIGFLLRATILWSIIGSFFLFKDERSLIKSKRFWNGIILATIGFIGVSSGGKTLPSGGIFMGNILVLGCSLFYALYNLGVRRNLVDVDPRLAFAVISLYTSIGTVILMIALGEPKAFYHLSWDILSLIVISSIIGIGIAHVLNYIAMKHIGVAISSSTSLIGIFITVILSYFIYGERLTIRQWFAGSLIMIGGSFLIWSQERVRKQYQ